MGVHAFIDESHRGQLYMVAVTIVNPGNLATLRRALRGLLLPGAREIHFRKEKDERRRMLAARIAQLPVEVTIYSCACGRADEPARQACLARIAVDLVARGAQRMVLDSRSIRDGNDRDFGDRETIRKALGKRPSETRLVYEHVLSTSEELLWIADAVAWCWGQGGAWRKRVDLIVVGHIVIEQPAVQRNAKPGRRPSGR
jgi:hypothetical protein